MLAMPEINFEDVNDYGNDEMKKLLSFYGEKTGMDIIIIFHS